MSTSWNELIKQLQELQGKFNKALRILDESKREKPGVCGHWSPRQVVAHMTGWEIETILQFERVRKGFEAIEHDIDAFNEKSVGQREHLNWDETINEFEEAQKKLNEAAESVSLNDESKNKGYRELMNVQISHYIHHIRQLEEWV